jgi:hypothetical protein
LLGYWAEERRRLLDAEAWRQAGRNAGHIEVLVVSARDMALGQVRRANSDGAEGESR